MLPNSMGRVHASLGSSNLHIGHVLIVARQATLDWFLCGGINQFLHCGKWCGAFRLDITEHLDRNQTITIRRL
jgi:hypothetical protein